MIQQPCFRRTARFGAVLYAAAAVSCTTPSSPQKVAAPLDLILRNGTVYDGRGGPPRQVDVGITGDKIVAIGNLAERPAKEIVDVHGMAVAPGFINMLSWSVMSLILDPRSESEIRQGVTLQIFGEGMSPGPLNEAMKTEMLKRLPAELKFDIEWNTLGEYLEYLERRGVSTNVASFVGATSVRTYVLGYDDRDPTADELSEMIELVRQAMAEGALGVGSALIYAPGFYAETEELIALARAAAEFKGMYISHMRSEGDRLVESVDELIRIAKESGAPAEIYHLKAAGKENWSKLQTVIERVEAARAEGTRITANMYTYTAGATGLDAAMPPWAQAGGIEAWIERLKAPKTRARIAAEMQARQKSWENLFFAAGPDKMLLVNFRSPELRHLVGRTLAEVAAERGTSAAETAMDLVIEDRGRVGTVYFLMAEDNVRRKVTLPWMSFGSDEASQPEDDKLFKSGRPHPRAFGNFARLLGRYTRDEKLITLPEAIRRLTSMPAEHLGLRFRGALEPGYFADIVVFDPAKIQDHATFEEPRKYATGVAHVFVNGQAVLRDGKHTGASAGRAVRGPGYVAPSSR